MLFLLSSEVSVRSVTMSIYIYVKNMANVKAVPNSWLSFDKIGTFAPHFISEESFGAEEIVEALVS